jgi:hypothetical protein
MFKLGIIEESLDEKDILEEMKPFLYAQSLEQVPTDENPLWHVNEYHISDDLVNKFLPTLADKVKHNYYIHAFSDDILIVILKDIFFHISRKKDTTWDEMIEYGVSVGVGRNYLESISLSV